MASPVELSAIPHLPGYGFKRKPKNYFKPQGFQVTNGVMVEHKEGVTFDRPKLVKMPKQPDERRKGSYRESTTAEDFKDPTNVQYEQRPAWDALERHVLRFYGYFKETVVEANLENWRVRNVVIQYHLEDDTCQIGERKQENSGIVQGQFLRRHRFPGPTGGYLSWQDLAVGSDLQLYGRTLRIIDCDGWTREFYDKQGQSQPEAEDGEMDAFMASSMKKHETSHGIPRTAERHYNEVARGGGHINKGMQQFLTHDGQVCRFYAVMDDLSVPQFERRPFEILFFLSDDTVEVREKYPLNCGRDNFPIFFRRAPMPRTRQVRGPLVPERGKDEYVGLTDFSVGAVHELMGNQFYIYDADEFTRNHFKQELRRELGPMRDVRLADRTVPRPKTPPYTGYGSWDDSMASVLHLVPQQPRKDTQKLYENDGLILRFTAQMHNPKREDSERQFVVNFHLFDDTMSIHEPPQRNLGIVTGRHLEKAVHLNQATGRLFAMEDFRPGEIIKVYNREFLITGMDEYTRKYIENQSQGRRYDLGAVAEKFREGLRQQYPLVRDVFRRCDLDHDGVITLQEFKKGLEKFSFQLSDEEVSVIMRHFDTRKDGQVSYNEFCDALLDEDYTKHMLHSKPSLQKHFDGGYAERTSIRAEERSETDNVRKAVRELGDIIYKRARMTEKLQKEFGCMTHEKWVTNEQVRYALAQFGHVIDQEDIDRVLLFVLPQVDLNRINYNEFLKAMITSYHDVTASR
mmetsp:Transcript_24164/g.53577  ORF Transcript_24164/g.53577 Transcript_24164/m.53577 type:complete len:743 (+) Transcript_24164:127-2355(+)